MRKRILKNGNINANGEIYLTKRILVSAARKGINRGAAETMKTLGYNIIAENGWAVKIFADGKREPLKELPGV